MNYCVCVNIFSSPPHVWCVCFSQGYLEKDDMVITMIEENVNHDTCHVAISRGPFSPQQAHPLVCYSLLPLPAPAAISSQRADPGNCFSLCKMKKRWKRTSGVRTNAQSLGLPKVHRLPTLRCFLPQRQSRSVCPPSWPCWRLPILKCSISHLWFLPLLSMRQNCWQAEREGNVWVFTSWFGLWEHVSSPAWNQVQKPLEQVVFPPWLVCLKVPSLRDVYWAQPFNVFW